MYAIVNLGAFAAVAAASAWGARTVEDMAGLARTRPLVGGSLAFALLCLAGLPPGVIGLVAKVVIFQSAVDGHLGWLAVVMAVNVAIGLVYYLRFIAVLVRPRAAGEPTEAGPEVSVVSGARVSAVTGAEVSGVTGAAVGAVSGTEASAVTGPRVEPAREVAVPWSVRVVLGGTLAAAVVLSILPGPLFDSVYR